MATKNNNKKSDETQKNSMNLKRKLKHSFSKVSGYSIAAFIDFKRSPMTIFFAVAYPIIITTLFGMIFSESAVSYTLYMQVGEDQGYIQDVMGTPVFVNVTDSIIAAVSEIKTEDNTSLINIQYIPLQKAGEAVDPGLYLEQQDNAYIGLVIPANYSYKLFTNASDATLRIIAIENDQSSSVVLHIVDQVFYNINMYIDALLDPMNPARDHFGMEVQNIYLEEDYDYFAYLVPGMICVAVMNNAVIGTVQRHSYFKKQGLFRKLASTPMTKANLVAGETIWQFFLGWISFIATWVCSYLIFSIAKGNYSWIIDVLDWKIIPIMISAAMGFTGLGMTVSRFVKNPDAAAGAANLLTFPMMFLSGAFFDISGNPVLNVISKFFPLTYLNDALRAAMITKQHIVSLTNLGYGFAFCLAIFILGIFLTKITDE